MTVVILLVSNRGFAATPWAKKRITQVIFDWSVFFSFYCWKCRRDQSSCTGLHLVTAKIKLNQKKMDGSKAKETFREVLVKQMSSFWSSVQFVCYWKKTKTNKQKRTNMGHSHLLWEWFPGQRSEKPGEQSRPSMTHCIPQLLLRGHSLASSHVALMEANTWTAELKITSASEISHHHCCNFSLNTSDACHSP